MIDEQKLRELAEAATPGVWENCILDRDLENIPAYVNDCIKASPGDEFYFVVGKHPDGGDADLCHVGNGLKSGDNSAYIAAARPAVILSLLDELATLRQERTAWRVSAENAEKLAARWKHLEYMNGRGIPMETMAHYIARPERLDYSAELHKEHAAKETP